MVAQLQGQDLNTRVVIVNQANMHFLCCILQPDWFLLLLVNMEVADRKHHFTTFCDVGNKIHTCYYGNKGEIMTTLFFLFDLQVKSHHSALATTGLYP